VRPRGSASQQQGLAQGADVESPASPGAPPCSKARGIGGNFRWKSAPALCQKRASRRLGQGGPPPPPPREGFFFFRPVSAFAPPPNSVGWQPQLLARSPPAAARRPRLSFSATLNVNQRQDPSRRSPGSHQATRHAPLGRKPPPAGLWITATWFAVAAVRMATDPVRTWPEHGRADHSSGAVDVPHAPWLQSFRSVNPRSSSPRGQPKVQRRTTQRREPDWLLHCLENTRNRLWRCHCAHHRLHGRVSGGGCEPRSEPTGRSRPAPVPLPVFWEQPSITNLGRRRSAGRAKASVRLECAVSRLLVVKGQMAGRGFQRTSMLSH